MAMSFLNKFTHFKLRSLEWLLQLHLIKNKTIGQYSAQKSKPLEHLGASELKETNFN